MIIFGSMALLGIGLLAVSFIFGHDDHGGIDHHIGHDIHGDHQSPGFFNIRVMSVFLATGGACGMIGEWQGLSQAANWAVAFFGGLMFGEIARRILGKLFSVQADGNNNSDYTGLKGILKLPITKNGPGEVYLTSKSGQQVWVTAYAKDGMELEIGDEVTVISSLPDRVIVEKTK